MDTSDPESLLNTTRGTLIICNCHIGKTLQEAVGMSGRRKHWQWQMCHTSSTLLRDTYLVS